jgi:hypothetical protein
MSEQQKNLPEQRKIQLRWSVIILAIMCYGLALWGIYYFFVHREENPVGFIASIAIFSCVVIITVYQRKLFKQPTRTGDNPRIKING